MSLRIKKQFPEFDISEYTDEKEITIDGVITEVKNFDWVNESLKSSKIIEEHAEPSIWFKNELRDIFAISLADTDKFAIYYSPSGPFKRSSTSVVSGQEQVISLIRLFEKQERDTLQRQLRLSEYHIKTPLILDFFSLYVSKEKSRNSREINKEEFIYEIKYSTILKKLLFSIAFLLLPIIIWGTSQTNDKPFNWNAFLGIQAFCTLFAIPAIIIAINHLKKNGNWKVYFRKGDNIFFIVSSSGKEMFDKTDFVKRIRIENNSNAPWNGYECTTLVNNSGRQIHLSNLLIPSADIEKLFGRLDETTEKRFLQIIKDR